jgi:epoxyqueuosine reductase
MVFPHKLTQRIKQKAHELGFHHVGITTPEPPAHLDIYQQWLSAGHHADMAWMAADEALLRRADPRRILPECQSILCLGMHYYPSPLLPSPNGSRDCGEGRIASYAWGDDYHDTIGEGLKKLVLYIENQLGHSIPNRWYTDTGPILEKELAQRAGLGWIGKNTNLINPQSGSYFLLAEIFLGIELLPDNPFPSDHCGSCTRCIESCPTDCILPNRTIDASRCISYLTIELKGHIPQDLRPDIGEWVFGCDICQQVCPWNLRFASDEGDARFAPRFGVPPVSLKDELPLSPQEFNRKFKGSPIKRTKRRGYLRNVAVALGNMRNPEAVLALSQSLMDNEALVRGHAAWALGQIGGQAAYQALQAALNTEEDHFVRHEIQQSLTHIKNHPQNA